MDFVNAFRACAWSIKVWERERDRLGTIRKFVAGQMKSGKCGSDIRWLSMPFVPSPSKSDETQLQQALAAFCPH